MTGSTHLQFVERAPDRGQKLLVCERFGEKFLGTGLDRRDGTFDRRIARNHHHFSVFEILAYVSHEIQTTYPWHLEIRDNQINLCAL